jgi:hypothetical protein
MVEYVGLDVSKEATSFCVVDEAGRILSQAWTTDTLARI